MQRSIRSFFYPKNEGKVKKPEKETSNSVRETEPPSKVALKERNGEVPESDSPVKRPGRKVARVLGSEGEEEEDEALTPSKGQKPAPSSPQVSPPSPVTFPESSPSLSSSPVDISPAGIPKRRTARKQLPKRTIQDVLEEQGKDEDREAKRKKEEEAETPPESLTEPEVTQKEEAEGEGQPVTPPEHPETSSAEPPPDTALEAEVAGKREAREEDPAKPPAKAPKTVSSFFAPRKPATKKEGKEEREGNHHRNNAEWREFKGLG